MNTPKKSHFQKYPSLSDKSVKHHRKLVSTSNTFYESPSNVVMNNFEFHRNDTQKHFYTQEFYRSKSTRLNLKQKINQIDDDYQFLANRIKLIQMKKEKAQKRAYFKENHIRSFLLRQKSKTEISMERGMWKERMNHQLFERSQQIQSLNEESKKNYFIRRNKVLSQNYKDAEETRSKSLYYQECLNEKLTREFLQKSNIVQKIKNDEKTWNEKKRFLWKKKMVENKQDYNRKMEEEKKSSNDKLELIKKLKSEEKYLISDLNKTLKEENSLSNDFKIISTQEFKINRYLMPKFSQPTTPNIKHRKFSKI